MVATGAGAYANRQAILRLLTAYGLAQNPSAPSTGPSRQFPRTIHDLSRVWLQGTNEILLRMSGHRANQMLGLARLELTVTP